MMTVETTSIFPMTGMSVGWGNGADEFGKAVGHEGFVSPAKELGLYPVVNVKLSEGDMIRIEFQSDHSGCSVEIRLEMEQDKKGRRIRSLLL